MNDSEFDELLRRAARDEAPLPPSFRQGVWHRIEMAAQHPPEGIPWLAAVAAVFSRPWGAFASVATTVALGLWLGAASLPEAPDAKAAYAESISPFAHTTAK
ncbi:hypothetical protein [Haloferula sp. BvORR071]|uniref:hypothetical protein n=1 Tax=Haloferula sp. BvORR071 TaxID=1396141 RepID=UPI0005592CC9|nr:hypothetical protein [Haloferula sp. BvORR071]